MKIQQCKESNFLKRYKRKKNHFIIFYEHSFINWQHILTKKKKFVGDGHWLSHVEPWPFFMKRSVKYCSSKSWIFLGKLCQFYFSNMIMLSCPITSTMHHFSLDIYEGVIPMNSKVKMATMAVLIVYYNQGFRIPQWLSIHIEWQPY